MNAPPDSAPSAISADNAGGVAIPKRRGRPPSIRTLGRLRITELVTGVIGSDLLPRWKRRMCAALDDVRDPDHIEAVRLMGMIVGELACAAGKSEVAPEQPALPWDDAGVGALVGALARGRETDARLGAASSPVRN